MVNQNYWYLHGILGVFIIEYERLLDELVIGFQLVDVGFVVDDQSLILLQLIHLILQRTTGINRATSELLKYTYTHLRNE